jgi:hypothetical protein
MVAAVELTCTLLETKLRDALARPTMGIRGSLSMPLPPSTKEVEAMVRTKLRYQHPRLYRSLLASDELDEVAKARARMFDETFYQVESELSWPAHRGIGENADWEKKVANLYRARDQATERALAAALEFPEDSEENSQEA